MNPTMILVVAPARLIAVAEEVLRSPRPCDAEQWLAVRAVAKALLDETEEMWRTAHDDAVASVQVVGRSRVQINNVSPPAMAAKAASVKDLELDDAALQAKVRAVVNGYLQMARENEMIEHTNFEAFCEPGMRIVLRDL